MNPYGIEGVKANEIGITKTNGEVILINGCKICGENSKIIRGGEVKLIDVFYYNSRG